MVVSRIVEVHLAKTFKRWKSSCGRGGTLERVLFDVVVEVHLLFAHQGRVKSGGPHTVTAVHQLGHLSKEERQQQLRIWCVNVRVSQENDLAIANLGEVKLPSTPAPMAEPALEFGVLQDLVGGRFLDVQDLPRIAGSPGSAGRARPSQSPAIPLDDKQFRTRAIVRRAVDELARSPAPSRAFLRR